MADAPDVPEFVASTDRQIENFKDFTRRMEVAGIAPEIRHLANTAATLSRSEIHFELTRPVSACMVMRLIRPWARQYIRFDAGHDVAGAAWYGQGC